jgi:hypothetical protein
MNILLAHKNGIVPLYITLFRQLRSFSLNYYFMRLIIVVILFFFPFISFSQYNTNENKQWCFGRYAGLDFTSGSPMPFVSSFFTSKTTGTVSDPLGNLLFYTDGDTVWNKLHNIMPSGSYIVPFGLARNEDQATLITPTLSNPNQYYIFSIVKSPIPGNTRRYLSYSIVDMTLDGGFGDVISSGTIIDTVVGQKVIAVTGNNCNIWLLTHQMSGFDFRAYEITASGISSLPVVSAVPTSSDFFTGVMKVSPDRSKIANASYIPNVTEIYDFDANTGVVSNGRTINTYYSYGVEFSPDNTKLYSWSSPSTPPILLQYDVSLATTAAIIASVYSVTASPGPARDLKLGPDGKIYFSDYTGTVTRYLNCITNPNLSGSSCGYVAHAVDFLTPKIAGGLPNLYWSGGTVAPITGTTTLCQGTSTTLSSSTPGGTWSSGNTSVATVGSGTGIVSGVAPGTAIISYSTGCGMATTIVTVYANPAPIAGLAGVCVGATTALSNTVSGGTWSSSNTAVATVSGTGVVSGVAIGTSVITYSISGCYTTLTVTVSTSPGAITGTMILCAGATTTLSNAAGTTTSGNDIVTNGGRVLAITSLGTDIKAALNKSYENAAHIHYDGMYYRRDIGWEF